MKIKNRYFETLVKTGFTSIKDKELSVNASYFLAVLIGKLQEKMNVYFSQKSRLIEKYGKKDSGGKIIEGENGIEFIDEEAKVSFHQEFNTLMEIEIDIGMEKIDFSNESANFTVDEMMLMIPFIKEIKYG